MVWLRRVREGWCRPATLAELTNTFKKRYGPAGCSVRELRDREYRGEYVGRVIAGRVGEARRVMAARQLARLAGEPLYAWRRLISNLRFRENSRPR